LNVKHTHGDHMRLVYLQLAVIVMSRQTEEVAFREKGSEEVRAHHWRLGQRTQRSLRTSRTEGSRSLHTADERPARPTPLRSVGSCTDHGY